MKKTKIHIFLFNGFADWEIAFLTPEIKKNDKFEIIYFSKDMHVVCSMGGLKIAPDISLNDINIEDINVLILPGGTAWEKGENDILEPLVKVLFARNKTIAAICAATTYLAKLGILDNLNHTSNALEYLKYVVPQYKGENNYINALATTGENIITATGIAPIEFAVEVFRKLELLSENDIEKWFQLFKNGIWKE